jgi:hypothetical protein
LPKGIGTIARYQESGCPAPEEFPCVEAVGRGLIDADPGEGVIPGGFRNAEKKIALSSRSPSAGIRSRLATAAPAIKNDRINMIAILKLYSYKLHFLQNENGIQMRRLREPCFSETNPIAGRSKIVSTLPADDPRQ